MKEMIEMAYSSKHKRELLYTGTSYGYTYYIINNGTHPTAYVKLPKTHKFYEKREELEQLIGVHGGLTYASNILDIGTEIKKGWFIGWDYAHAGDFTCFPSLEAELEFLNGKIYTTKEMKKDARDVCKQLKILEDIYEKS